MLLYIAHFTFMHWNYRAAKKAKKKKFTDVLHGLK